MNSGALKVLSDQLRIINLFKEDYFHSIFFIYISLKMEFAHFFPLKTMEKLS